MKVNLNQTSTPAFGRKLTIPEKHVYTETVSQGLKVLDKKLGMIVHNSTVPAVAGENTGIGSLLSKSAEAFFIPFLKTHSFSTIQQEPNNMRSKVTTSPYSPVSISKNIFMIPIERLTTNDYINILSQETFDRLFKAQSARKSSDVNYPEVEKNYDTALWEAYRGLKSKLADPMHDCTRLETAQLTRMFAAFKDKNSRELVPHAIYEILTKEYNIENWKEWNEVDRNLYDTMPSEASRERLEQLKSQYKTEIDFFMFKQWLVEREIKESNKRNQKLGIQVIADSPIAFTPVEEWQNKDLFMQGYSLGCPPDYFAKEGQRWGFVTLRPETIFKPDGTLGRGGELMKKRYEKMFESAPGGARIDHIIGLIDPFIYTTTEKMKINVNAGRIYSSPNMKQFALYEKNSVDEYAEILSKIVIPAAEKYGLTKDNIICEDLGEITQPVRDVMKKLDLSGVSVTEFGYRGSEQPEKNIIMLGSHDNESFLEFTDNFIKRNDDWYNKRIQGLAEDTVLPGQDVTTYANEIKKDKATMRNAFFTELFTSPAKRIQIFFTDFFGIGRTYNKPGTTEGCWKLRIPANYEDLYEKSLQNGTALNIPEAIANAIRHKGNEFATKHQELLTKLDEFSKILKS